jgi:maleylpyruvate isomerase
MYPSSEQRDADIEAGAGRSGLDLQIDLDTSAGRLGAAFEALDAGGGWDSRVELRGGVQAPARSLPLARLMEVVLHHVDLDVGFGIDDVDPTTAEWVLEWSAFRVRARPEYPALLLVADSGFRLHVGSAAEPREVSGSSPRLLGWLTRRGGAEAVSGADGIELPAF